MWKRLRQLWPGPRVRNRVLVASAMLVIAILAFCWGRRGALPEATANPPDVAMIQDRPTASNLGSDYSKRVIAYIYNNIPITREELGEYLIARFGKQRSDFLINRRIVELACQAKGIYVSDVEVENQLKEDLAGLSVPRPLTQKEFETSILRRFNKTLFEWKEDVIRPKLAMEKLCRQRVVVTEEDVRNAFEAKYGEKVKCRWLVLPADERNKDKIWAEVRQSDAAFTDWAKKQFMHPLASTGGEAPPIHRHFSNAEIEREAFSLKPGEVSRILQLPPPEKYFVILKCDGQIGADTNKRLEEERLKLSNEVAAFKLQQEIPKAFQELRAQAKPVNFLVDTVRQEDLESYSKKEIGLRDSSIPEGPRAAPPPSK